MIEILLSLHDHDDTWTDFLDTASVYLNTITCYYPYQKLSSIFKAGSDKQVSKIICKDTRHQCRMTCNQHHHRDWSPNSILGTASHQKSLGRIHIFSINLTFYTITIKSSKYMIHLEYLKANNPIYIWLYMASIMPILKPLMPPSN